MSAHNYLVTGGAGFIGSNIVEELLARGHRVAVFDNFATGKRENLKPYLANIELIEADLRDVDAVKRACAGRDFVLHQAALGSVPRSVADPVTSHEVNITGTLNVLMAARDAGVKRVVAASSSSVYGDTPTLPKIETMAVLPMSPYAVTKLATEKYCAAFFKVYGLETIALRYFNIYGPRQDPNGQYAAVIPRFISALRHGEQPVIYGDGLQSRDFTFVSLAVQANLLACEAPGVAGEFYNVACGGQYSLLDVLGEINKQLGTDIVPRHEPARRGDVKHSRADISRIQTAMNYQPTVSLQAGMERTVAHFLKVVA
jgi:UDP-glucose 4-epimerase